MKYLHRNIHDTADCTLKKAIICTKEWRKSPTYETQRLLFALLESFTAREGKNNGTAAEQFPRCSTHPQTRCRRSISSKQKRSNRRLPLKVHFQSKHLSPGGDNPASIHLPSHSISQGSARGNNFEEIRWSELGPDWRKDGGGRGGG